MFIVHATSPTAEKMAQAAGLLPTPAIRKTYTVKTTYSAGKGKTDQPSNDQKEEVKKNG